MSKSVFCFFPTFCVTKKLFQVQRVPFVFSLVQFGFRKNTSTTDALVFTIEKIRKEIDNNHFVAAAFLDLSKAFDCISHGIPLKKLGTLHFDLNAVSLIQSFLTGRTQR